MVVLPELVIADWVWGYEVSIFKEKAEIQMIFLMWNLPILKAGSDIFKAPYKPKQNICAAGPWATILILLLQEMVSIAFIFVFLSKLLQLLNCHRIKITLTFHNL